MEVIVKLVMTAGVFIPVLVISLMWLGSALDSALTRSTTLWPFVFFFGGVVYFVFWFSWSVSLWSGQPMWWPSTPQINWEAMPKINWELATKSVISIIGLLPLAYFGYGGYHLWDDDSDPVETNVYFGLAGVSVIGLIVLLAWVWQ